mgnify:CR=1 FL=1
MARKDRVPDPPRRPQAPQRRSTPSTPADAERRRRLLYLVAGSGIAAIAVVLAIVFLAGGGSGRDAQAALVQAGCTVRTFPGQTAQHTTELLEKIKWNSSPPTNGRHYQVPAVWGAYDEPLVLSQVVHNLEHGGVYMLYGSGVDADTVTSLRRIYDDDPRGLLLAPLPSLGKEFALGAWTTVEEEPGDGTGRLARCARFDADAVRAFLDAYRFQGPERFPPESLQPGT